MSLVEADVDGHVATLTLNRPEARNALSVQMCDALAAALGAVDKDEAARVAVVRGAGNVFCAGADFAAVSGPDGPDFIVAFEAMLEAVAHFRLPTIAAIHGAALGGGLQLATVCDFRIAASDARIGIPSARLGIVVNLENVRRLVLLAGLATATEVLIAGRAYTGEEAAAAGLVNAAVPPQDLDREVTARAHELAALAPLAMQGIKATIRAVADHIGDIRSQSPDRAGTLDALVADAYRSADLAEGLRALAEKRPPRFEGR